MTRCPQDLLGEPGTEAGQAREAAIASGVLELLHRVHMQPGVDAMDARGTEAGDAEHLEEAFGGVLAESFEEGGVAGVGQLTADRLNVGVEGAEESRSAELGEVAVSLAQPAGARGERLRGGGRFSVEGQQGGDLFEDVGGAASIHGG